MALLYFYVALVVVGIVFMIAGYSRRNREQPFFAWEFPPSIFVARERFKDVTGYRLTISGSILMSVGGLLALIYWVFVV